MQEANVPPIHVVDEVPVEQDTSQISVLTEEERQEDQRTTEEVVSDVVAFVLDDESDIYAYEDPETLNSDRERIIVDGQGFYEELRGLLTAEELNQIFITDSQGELRYPAGVNVVFDIEYSDRDRTTPTSLNVLIEHNPMESFNQDDASGGVSYSVPVEDDPSMRKIQISVNTEGSGRLSIWSFGADGGYELRGGIVEGALIMSGERRGAFKESTFQGLQPLDSMEDTGDFFAAQTLMENLQEWLTEQQPEENS
jgi:hypothetical protein